MQCQLPTTSSGYAEYQVADDAVVASQESSVDNRYGPASQPFRSATQASIALTRSAEAGRDARLK
jgi:hypothetical protein